MTELQKLNINIDHIIAGGPQQGGLRVVQLKMWSNSECADTYGPAAPGGIVSHHMCAGGYQKDSCSVSPIIVLLYIRVYYLHNKGSTGYSKLLLVLGNLHNYVPILLRLEII